jgi:hypothetical protein
MLTTSRSMEGGMTMPSNTVTWVLDYAAMGRPKVKPRYLHRRDCIHPSETADWRPATPEELRTLRECRDCQSRDTDDRVRRA